MITIVRPFAQTICFRRCSHKN